MNILKKLLFFFFALTIVTQSIATPPKNKPETDVSTEKALKVFFEILEKAKNDDSRKREQAVIDKTTDNTNLHRAVFEHNIETIRSLLKQKPQHLSFQNKNGNTPLHIALAVIVNENDENLEEKQRTINEIINILVKKIEQQENANTIFNTQNTFGITPLHVATGTNKIEAIKTLLNTNKIKTDIPDKNEYTALLIAAKLGFTEIVNLLATEENIYITNNDGNTSLHLAAKSRNTETVLAILKKEREDENRTKNIMFIKNNQGLIPIQCSDLYADSHNTLNTLHNQMIDILITSLETESTDEFIKRMKLIKTTNITNVIELYNLNTILHIAGYKGYFEKTKAILENFTIDINVKNKSDNTPLHVATLNEKNNVLDVIKLLVKNGANINAINSNGNTPLHLATIRFENNAEVIDFLLTQENVNINHIDNNKLRPLHIAIINDKIEIINKLIKHGAIIDSDMFEAAKGHPIIIRILKRAQKERESKNAEIACNTELSEKEREQNLEDLISGLEIAKKKKQEPKKKNKKKKKNPKSPKKVKTLKTKEKQPNKKEQESQKDLKTQEEQAKAIKAIREKKEKEKLEKKRKIEIEKMKKTKKQEEEKTAWNTKREKAAIKIQNAFRNYKKRKKIYKAIDFAHITHKDNCITQFNDLLFTQRFMTGQFFDEKFEDLNYIAKDFKDKNENTALHLFAQSKNHSKYIPILLNHGAEINAINKDGMTSLHSAVYHGNENAVELLIQHGADVNTHENNLGFTPLHEAVNKKIIRIVRMLVANGANNNALDKKGKSPFAYTQKSDFTAALCGKKIPNDTNVNSINKPVIIDLSDEYD